MTGRYNIRTGVFSTPCPGGGIMGRSSETTLAEILNESGYKDRSVREMAFGNNYTITTQDSRFRTIVWNIGGGLGKSRGIWLIT